MNNDPRSTNDVRLIAQDVTRQQAAVCAERRGRTGDKLAALTAATEANARVVATLSEAVATLTATVTQVAATVAAQSAVNSAQEAKLADHETRLAVLGVRVTIAAIIGGSLPQIAKWVIEITNH